MTTVRKPAVERQQEIVEMALRLLSELGEGGVSAQTIADHIGITRVGLFQHIPTKNGLWIAALSEIERLAHHSWERASREGDPTVVRRRKTLLAQIKLIENCPAVPSLLFSPGRMVAEEVVHPIHVRIMTALRLRITEERYTAVQECGQDFQIKTREMESLLLEGVQDCVLRWSLTGRGFDLVAEGVRLIGLQIRLSGLKARGDKS
ncbi:TetR/AcrR family transcriptional regulator [Roseovarius sp.]|uniref:TetR/AcrR family transcriptional regulator n=1 Tax=Roseovarius sp. TaxID=1486281 RepID=UPI003A97AF09